MALFFVRLMKLMDVKADTGYDKQLSNILLLRLPSGVSEFTDAVYSSNESDIGIARNVIWHQGHGCIIDRISGFWQQSHAGTSYQNSGALMITLTSSSQIK